MNREPKALNGERPPVCRPLSDKQDLYEQTAIVGMLMATSRLSMKSQPQPQVMAQMKTAARHHLEQVLHTDANRVEITASGLVVH